jgi:hypothetical protein
VRAARLHALVQVRLSLLPRCTVTVKHTQYPLTFVICACSYRSTLRKHELLDHGMHSKDDRRPKPLVCEVDDCGRGYRCVAAFSCVLDDHEEYFPPRYCHRAR